MKLIKDLKTENKELLVIFLRNFVEVVPSKFKRNSLSPSPFTLKKIGSI